MNVTAITCTGNRPEAFALCEKYMARQLFQPAQWMVLCDGETPTTCTMGQTFAHSPAWRGLGSMMAKLRFAFDSGLIKGDAVAFVEDDDWYSRSYLETQVNRMQSGLDVVGESDAIYWNAVGRWWYDNRNKNHSSLCATAISRTVYGIFRNLCNDPCPFVDIRLWRSPVRMKRVFPRTVPPLVVGIKSMPGRKGFGSGHIQRDRSAIPDRDMSKLREWLGDDADAYSGFYDPLTEKSQVR